VAGTTVGVGIGVIGAGLSPASGVGPTDGCDVACGAGMPVSCGRSVALELAAGVGADPEAAGAAEGGMLGDGELWTDTQPLTAITPAASARTNKDRRVTLGIMEQ